MQIRASQKEDITAIMSIYEKARAFMDQTGNPTQWGDGYPQQDLIEEDLQQGHSYVCEENGKIVGTFTLIFGEDPTYQIIEKGAWHSQQPYGRSTGSLLMALQRVLPAHVLISAKKKLTI